VREFDVLDVAQPADAARWLRLWRGWPGREVFAHPEYVRLFARPFDRVLCAVGQSLTGVVLFPFILRPLGAEAFAGPTVNSWDLTSPYGYGGAFVAGPSVPDGKSFDERLTAWLAANEVVSSFVRMSLFPEQVLPFAGEVRPRSLNVVRDLTPAPDAIWRDYDHKVRKNVTRAKSEGLTVDFDLTGTNLSDFVSVYRATMDRRGATKAYYFSSGFFEDLVRYLSDQFVLVHVRRSGKVVASELALLSEYHAYSFLGGALPEAFSLRASDLLKHELFLWARHMGKRAFILGGGHSKEDGIYRFKKSFAPGGVVPFYVGTAVHDSTAFQDLMARRRAWARTQGVAWEPAFDFFPAYRA
jgi:hypothetical protein